jgi:hypothetical protein
MVVDVKSSYDPQPSVLRRPLAERAPSTEPQAKRQKAEQASTVMTRVSANSYSTLEDIVRDIDSAVSDIIGELDLPEDAVRHRYIPIAPENVALSSKILAFKHRAHDLVLKNSASNQKSSGVSPEIGASMREDKLVLSLYGNTASGPKQLFSSKQQPHPAGGADQENIQSIRDIALPNGMATTRIKPTKSSVAAGKKRGTTLGDLFPTPPSLPTLEPPNPSKVATTRAATVGWYLPDTSVPPQKSEDYYKQPISTGQWLDYSNASPSHSSKRRQRGRTMSFGGSKAPQLDADTAESEAAKLEGLFRGAYSEFAPTKDNAAAVVTVDLMNRIWWEKNGEKSFERLVENSNGMGTVFTTESTGNNPALVDVDEDEKFREAVEKYEEEAVDPTLEAEVEKSAEEKDVDEILDGISELLETLSSYQRIRNLSLNSSDRPVGLLSAPDTTSLGTPSTPSESEIATYEILKSQLALMIATLPPFAVAKLDSDRLAELSISSKIPIPMAEYNGVLEEEEEVSNRTRLAGLAPSSTTSRAQTAPIQRHSSSALYGNQYSAPRSAGPISQQYYGSQTPVRASSGNLQRPPATAPAPYPVQRSAAGTAYRQSSYGTPSYPHQAPRSLSQQSLSQQYNPSPQYLQTAGAQSYSSRPPNQPYQSIPQSSSQASVNGRYQGQPTYPHQTPTQNGLGYPYGNGVNTNGQMSPQRGLYSPQPTSTQLQGQSSYSTQTPPTSQGVRPYIQNSMPRSPMANGASPQSPQPQPTQQTLGLTTPYSTFMTTAEQASMMERQRAQLAQQQGLQQQARNAAQAGTMGSPPKPQVNGNALAAGL